MSSDAARNIAVIQIGKIGDMILMTPLFRKLKSIFPDSHLSVLASPANSLIASNDANVDSVFQYTKNPAADIKLLLSDLRKNDIWIDTKPENSDTSRLLLKLLTPRFSLGYNNGKNTFDVDLSVFQSGKHAVDINLSPVRYFGKSITAEDRLPEISLDGELNETELKLAHDKSGSKVVVNISAGKSGRQLDTEIWSKAIKEISNRAKLSIYTISHPDDEKLAEKISANTGSGNIHTKDILETAAIINIADYVITPDTSIVHICSAFNKPVTALYPAVEWNYERFAPLSDNFESIISESPDSIKSIKPHEIADAFMRLYDNVSSGNAESRTRVRKEDH